MAAGPHSEPVRRISFDTFRSMWLDRVAGGIGGTDERRYDVAYVIAQHLHPKTLRAAIRVRDLARMAQINANTCRRIIREMERDGLLDFERGFGRGNWSTYRPRLRVPFEIVKGGR